jgi:hypothetical protein
MAYEVEVERAFRAWQGLPSPVRERRGLTLLVPGGDVEAVPQLAWVELEDRTFGSRTRYQGR